jgi:hypothetical protein
MISIDPPKNRIYRIDYPMYFQRNAEQDLPEYCGCPWNLKVWFIHNNVLEPIISQLHYRHYDADIWSRSKEFSIDDFDFKIVNDTYYEDDFSIEISLKKEISITKQVTEVVPAVMNPGEPYQPETTEVVEEYEYLLSKEVFCRIGLEAKRYLE